MAMVAISTIASVFFADSELSGEVSRGLINQSQDVAALACKVGPVLLPPTTILGLPACSLIVVRFRATR